MKKAGECPLFLFPYQSLINLIFYFPTRSSGNKAGGRTKTKMEKKCSCPNCEKRQLEDARREEANFAVLVALVPMLTLTMFNVMGLF